MFPLLSCTEIICTTFFSGKFSFKNLTGAPIGKLLDFVSLLIAVTDLLRSYPVAIPSSLKSLCMGSGSADELTEKSTTSNVSNFTVEDNDDCTCIPGSIDTASL